MTGEFSIAVHALVYLNHKAKQISSEELATNICTNPARVRKVMAKLKKAGLVSTKEGNVGGYRFDLDAATITLQQVALAVGEEFVGTSWRSGDCDMKCLIASGMADIMDGIYAQMGKQCQDFLASYTILTIDQMIFGGKA